MRIAATLSLLITLLTLPIVVPPATADDSSPQRVSVDQTSNVVDQVLTVRWQHFTPSSATRLSDNLEYPVAVYQCEGTEVTKREQCIGTFEYTEANNINRQSEGNQVYAATRRDGTGQAQIAIRTRASDPQLDCDFEHPCSIVIEPATGGLPGACTDHSLDELLGYHLLSGLKSIDAGYHACSWAQRIVVPISFAPTVADCPQADSAFTAEGSPMLQRAMQQWSGGMCKGANSAPPMRVGAVDVDEFSARLRFTLDSTNKEPSIPLTSVPIAEAGARKHTYAPLGVSAISVAYVVDDQRTGSPVTDLVLNARLLAKMLTQSYASGVACPANFYACDKGVTGNADSVFTDPEFRQLNPQYRPSRFSVSSGSSFPIVVGDNSDMTYELTRWIDSDPQAAAFLQGYPDPWGTHINHCYLETIEAGCGGAPPYPISQFTNNSDPDVEVRKPQSGGCSADECFAVNGGMYYTWTPVHGVVEVARSMAANKLTAKSLLADCENNEALWDGNECRQHPSSEAQNMGSRAMFAIMPQADAEAYSFPTARLVTNSGSAVAPTPTSMSAALQSMTTNADGITQQQNYRMLSDPEAYPLTMVDYAAVPTCDVSEGTASSVAEFLDYVAFSDAAQTSGRSPGMLAPGYLPLTGTMKEQVADAAESARDATKSCNPAPPDTQPPPSTPPTDSPTSPTDPPATPDDPPPSHATEAPPSTPDRTPDQISAPSTSDPAPGVDESLGTTPPAETEQPPVQKGSGQAKPGPQQRAADDLDRVAFGTPQPDESPLSGLVLPLALLVGGALLIGGPSLYLLGRTGIGPVIATQLRRLIRRR